MNRKKIGVMIRCYNEQDNVIPIYYAIVKIFEEKLMEYDYIIQFIDNNSTDKTQENIRKLCIEEKNVRAIFNAKNFKGFSGLYGLIQMKDCDGVVYIAADFQDPVETIPDLVRKWEEGYLIAAAVKTQSQENHLMYKLRSLFYKIMRSISSTKYIDQFCNFALFDKKFIEILASLKNPSGSIRGNVAEYGYDIAYIPYNQAKRRSGQSKCNLWVLLNSAIEEAIYYNDIILRLITLFGLSSAIVFFVVGIIYFILKCIYWSKFSTGIAPILIGMFFIGSVQTFLLGILGEYLLVIKKKVTDSPMVIVKEKLNFEDDLE